MMFCYTKVNGRLCPSIRHQLKTDGHGKNVDNDVVFKVDIERALPLNVLMKMYPLLPFDELKDFGPQFKEDK